MARKGDCHNWQVPKTHGDSRVQSSTSTPNSQWHYSPRAQMVAVLSALAPNMGSKRSHAGGLGAHASPASPGAFMGARSPAQDPRLHVAVMQSNACRNLFGSSKLKTFKTDRLLPLKQEFWAFCSLITSLCSDEIILADKTQTGQGPQPAHFPDAKGRVCRRTLPYRADDAFPGEAQRRAGTFPSVSSAPSCKPSSLRFHL